MQPLESPSQYPFKNSRGTFSLKNGQKVQYIINTEGTVTQPVSLTLQLLDANGTHIGNNETDSTLYFNTEGMIVDRAPADTHTNAKKLQAMYASTLLEFIDGENGEEYNLSRGFFKQADAGVQRETNITAGAVRTLLIRDDI